ncbi:uncharacterized protein LOC113938446 [Zalophus californianus]|uniref:Uncharacterized protein LOC113938446 n=1 Tax=Zalophus californianus TaxID=9704 RepID=A0A6J2FI50_ZALCA|nr:uncharacterized protein LOC113938446 [Zalophus californianus]
MMARSPFLLFCLLFPSSMNTLLCPQDNSQYGASRNLEMPAQRLPQSSHTTKPRMCHPGERPGCLADTALSPLPLTEEAHANSEIWKKQKMMNDNLVTLMKQHTPAQKRVKSGNQIARGRIHRGPMLSACLGRTKLKGEMRGLAVWESERAGVGSSERKPLSVVQEATWATSATPQALGLRFPSALCSPPPHKQKRPALHLFPS